MPTRPHPLLNNGATPPMLGLLAGVFDWLRTQFELQGVHLRDAGSEQHALVVAICTQDDAVSTTSVEDWWLDTLGKAHLTSRPRVRERRPLVWRSGHAEGHASVACSIASPGLSHSRRPAGRPWLQVLAGIHSSEASSRPSALHPQCAALCAYYLVKYYLRRGPDSGERRELLHQGKHALERRRAYHLARRPGSLQH